MRKLEVAIMKWTDGLDEPYPPHALDEFPERTLIARIYRIDALDGKSVGKVSIELDGIDEGVLDDIGEERYAAFLAQDDDVHPFALLRLEITDKAFQKITGILPSPGLWFAVDLSTTPRGAGWPVDHAQLTDGGYTAMSSGYVGRIDFIAADDDVPPRPLGASVPIQRSRRQVAINGGAFPSEAIARGKARQCIWIEREPSHALVRDVGQASFVTLQDVLGSCLLHFDAGWPVAFNAHTAPPQNSAAIDFAPVLLSHWDWDHLHGYYIFPLLQTAPWFAPVQTLGPGASRVAARLDSSKRLIGISPGSHLYQIALRSVPHFTSCGTVAPCSGSAGNRNQTGLACSVTLTRSRLLMCGDADYHNAVPHLGGSPTYDALVVTHHGAQFGGLAPVPTRTGATAVVSYGAANSYGHPHTSMDARHPGWQISHTAANGATPRGSKTLS